MRKIIVAVMLLLGMGILMTSCSEDTINTDKNENAIIGKWLLTSMEEYEKGELWCKTTYKTDGRIEEYYENGKLYKTTTRDPYFEYIQFFDDGRVSVTHEYDGEKDMVIVSYILEGKNLYLDGDPWIVKKLTKKELVMYEIDGDDESWGYFTRVE